MSIMRLHGRLCVDNGLKLGMFIRTPRHTWKNYFLQTKTLWWIGGLMLAYNGRQGAGQYQELLMHSSTKDKLTKFLKLLGKDLIAYSSSEDRLLFWNWVVR